MRKSIFTIMTAAMLMSNTAPAFAGWALGADENAGRWWYSTNTVADGYYHNGWQWINGKCYYFDEAGWLLVNGAAPDGSLANEKGEWVVNGVVQKKSETGIHRAKSDKISDAGEKAALSGATGTPTQNSSSTEDFDTYQRSINSYEEAEGGVEEPDVEIVGPAAG